jgi:hypothetical protein
MLRDEGMLRGEEEARKEPVHNKKTSGKNIT